MHQARPGQTQRERLQDGARGGAAQDRPPPRRGRELLLAALLRRGAAPLRAPRLRILSQDDRHGTSGWKGARSLTPSYGTSIKDIQYLGVEWSPEVHHQHLQIERKEKDAGEYLNHCWTRGAECRVPKVKDGL